MRSLVHSATAHPAAIVAAMGVVAAGWAVGFGLAVFPYLSDNNDEAVYLLQADAFRHGHLFPTAPDPPEAFQPWLSTDSEDRFVSKYTPVYPAMLALSHTLTGSYRPAQGVVAFAAVVVCYLLAREILDSSRQAVLAAAFLTASPLFLVQSGTFLSYLLALMLLMGFAAALLAGVRRGSAFLLLAAGFLLATAAFARPYEALLFALPFTGWWAGSRRRRLAVLAREGRWLALGAAPPLLAMLAYFRAATGSYLQSPFVHVGPRDTLGFGVRQMMPEGPSAVYTPAKALVGMLHLSALTSFWTYGGLLLVLLVLAGLRWAPGRAEPWLALVGITVPLGYALFWGSWTSTQWGWGGPWRFGPFYWMLLLAPASILGAAGFRRLWRWDAKVAGVSAVALAAVSAFVVANAVRMNSDLTHGRARLFHAPHRAQQLAQKKPALVFLPPLQSDYLLQPFALARNAGFNGPVVWAIDRGPHGNRAVHRRFPGRVPYLVVARGLEAPSSLHRLEVEGNRLVRADGQSRRGLKNHQNSTEPPIEASKELAADIEAWFEHWNYDPSPSSGIRQKPDPRSSRRLLRRSQSA